MGSPWPFPADTSTEPYIAPVPIYDRVELINYSYYSASLDQEDSVFHENDDKDGISTNQNQYLNFNNCNINHNQMVLKKQYSEYFREDVMPPEQARKRIKINYVLTLREVPSWSIYFNDQRHQLANFSDSRNGILSDIDLNKCVSLCFDKNCIIKLVVDAVVTSTTENYTGESGVDKIVHDEAGRDLKDVCKGLPHCEVGNAEITEGFMLPARYIIHTNGPNSSNPEMLKQCYENCLSLLVQRELRTIAFPCISTGRKGVTKKIAAAMALSTVRKFLEHNKDKVDRVVFCLHNNKDIVIYRRFMQVYFPIE